MNDLVRVQTEVDLSLGDVADRLVEHAIERLQQHLRMAWIPVIWVAHGRRTAFRGNSRQLYALGLFMAS